VDHVEDYKHTQEWESFEAVITFLRTRCGLKQFSEADIARSLGVLGSNCCNMAEFRARGLFPIFSLINHSCAANSRHIVCSSEGTMEIVAKADIKAGEEITVRYTTNILELPIPRREHISSMWHFTCCCSRCSDPSPSSLAAMVCLQCSSSLLLPTLPLDPASPWQCQTCSAEVKASEVMARVAKVNQSLAKVSRTDVKKLESFLTVAQKILHPHHATLLDVKWTLFFLYGGSTQGIPQSELTQEQVARKLALGQEYIEAVGKVDPGLTKWRGQIQYETNKFKFILAMQDLQTRKLNVEGFMARVTESVEELEGALGGMMGEKLPPVKGLKARLARLGNDQMLGPGYACMIGMILKLPFIQ